VSFGLGRAILLIYLKFCAQGVIVQHTGQFVVEESKHFWISLSALEGNICKCSTIIQNMIFFRADCLTLSKIYQAFAEEASKVEQTDQCLGCNSIHAQND
jgi:hypothetical protein